MRASSDFIAQMLQPLLVGYALRSELESLADTGRGNLLERELRAAGEVELERELRILMPVLLEPKDRCLHHLRSVANSVAPAELPRAGMKEYFALQQRVISCLDRLVERSRGGAFLGAPLRLAAAGDQMDDDESHCPATAADDWLFRPLPEHEKQLSIVFLLCDSIYAGEEQNENSV